MSRPLSLAAFLLVSLGAVAAEAPRVLPVLSQESGRVEAVLLLDEPESSVSARSLDRVLTRGNRAAAASQFKVQLGGGSKLSANLSLDAQPGLALLCRGNIGLGAALGSLNEQCLLADIGAADPLLGWFARSANLEGQWQTAGAGLDISFGLSWLKGQRYSDAAIWSPQLNPPLLPAEAALSQAGLLAPQLLSSRSVSFAGIARVGSSGWIGLEGIVAKSSSLSTFQGSPIRWDSTALSLGGGYGAVSGKLTGRLIKLPDADRSAFDLDVGVSWQAPWQARVTIGARNLLGRQDLSQWPLVTLPDSVDKDTRTPYIRYRQDL